MSSVLKSFKRFLNKHLNLPSSTVLWFLYLMILGGSGSKLVPKIVATTYENQKERFRTNMCYENF